MMFTIYHELIAFDFLGKLLYALTKLLALLMYQVDASFWNLLTSQSMWKVVQFISGSLDSLKCILSCKLLTNLLQSELL